MGPYPDALGTVEETPFATAGGTSPPAITAGPPPPGTVVPGGTEEPSSVTYVELHPLRWKRKSKEGKQHQATGNNRPQRFTILKAYLHNQPYYTVPNPSSVCFQRQYQGELCPSSHACSNSTYNTNNIVSEALLKAVKRWVGEGGKATLVGALPRRTVNEGPRPHPGAHQHRRLPWSTRQTRSHPDHTRRNS